MPSTRSNDDIKKAIEVIRQTISALEKINSREAKAELFVQKIFLADLKASRVRIQPMSKKTKDTLKSLLTKLNRFVRAGQEFDKILALAQNIKKLID